MKQRGRSPMPKSQGSRHGSDVTNAQVLRTGGASSKSLLTDYSHDSVSSDANFTEYSKDDSSLAIPSSIPIRSHSQTLSPCHTTSKSEFLFDDLLDPNGVDDHLSLTQKAIEQIQSKISKTKELIRDEQTSRDNNVNEYLKLSANAERQQQNRIKQVFEKKNQKSAQSILILQKKLEEYQRKVRDLEEHGIHKSSQNIRQSIKSVGGNIRDGLTGMSSTVMSKPKELAAHLLKHRSGSFDNLTDSGDTSVKDKPRFHQGSSSLPREDTSSNHEQSSSEKDQQHNQGKCLSDDGVAHPIVGRCSGVASESDESVPPVGSGLTSAGHQFALMSAASPRHSDHEWKTVVQELSLLKEEVDRLREDIIELKQYFKQELEMLSYQLREERDHCDRLEDQIRDLTELHQHEILSIRAVVTDMEEKVQYQSEERLLDIREHLQSLETKVTSIEHQATQQQYLNIEGLDSSDARAIMMKLLTAAITVIHVVLFFLGTFLGLAKPFVRTTARVALTAVFVSVSVVVYHKQESLVAMFLKLKNKQLQSPDGDKG